MSLSTKKVPVYNRLKYFRETLDTKQKELEWRNSIGIRQWPHYESGQEPGIKLAQRFARTFNEIATEKGIDLKKKLTADDLYPDEPINEYGYP